MPRPSAPLDPFEPLGDDFDVPAFVVLPRPKSRPASSRPASNAPRVAKPTNDRPPTSRTSSARPSSASRPVSKSASGNRPSSRPATASTSRPVSESRLAQRPAPKSRSTSTPPSRVRWTPARSFSMRAVHFQIGGVLLVALSVLLTWNTLTPATDGLLPRYGVLVLRQLFGSGAALVPLGLGILGTTLVFKRQNARVAAFWRGAGLALLVFLCARHLQTPRGQEFFDAQTIQSHGGLVGATLAWAMRRVFGEVGSYVALAALGVVSLLLWSEHTLGELGQRFADLWSGWKDEWNAERETNRAHREFRREEQRREREDRTREHDEQLELWRDEESFTQNSIQRPQTPSRRQSRSLAEIRAQNERESKSASKSPFLEAGDWFGGEDETGEFPAPFREVEWPDPVPAVEVRRQTPRAVENSEADELVAESPVPVKETKAGKGAKPALEPKPEPEGPRIEIIHTPPPASVLDLDHLLSNEVQEELSPNELLEQQALESAQDADEIEVPRVQRIEKPRRHFGEGPLMPEYFDDGVRALDPPVLPDLEGAEEELQRGVVGVQETLAAFKIDARVTDVKRGPVITRYEVQPAPGVRVAAIANLDRDLARSLSALSVRIEAPVPGKNVVGIEVPNKKVHLVRMRDVLEQHDFLSHPSKLAFVLGKDIAGQPKWGDLAKMPHMLIAGSTNSGKSVCLNSIIASILVRSGPEEVRFSLIDPKRVELTLYRGIPHLMHDVVVEPKQAVIALRRAIEEMDRRYRLFATRGVRNIASYNSKLRDGERPMPYIVIVIDELADLMMTAAAEFEKLICRLAQLARATGIHLIVATQRPSVNVITGVIKANIPARVAFAVASQVDSRTILDSVGAERLIGSGDMLYDANNGGKSTRIQGAFLSEEEVNRIVEVIKANYQYEDSIPEDLPSFDLFVEDEDDDGDARSGGFSSDEKRDSLFDDIVEFVLRHNDMSASNIQRKFGIGYPRAGRIVDQLEKAGILGPADGPKARKVLGRGDTAGTRSEEDE
ncbi:DNA translocase SpoIIIE [Abditibacteriota bacterium]|nr:DNA translocase SpoIIIE [Abditibacteriota bacterium]